MGPYSMDLRERVAAAIERAKAPNVESSSDFGQCTSFVNDRLLQYSRRDAGTRPTRASRRPSVWPDIGFLRGTTRRGIPDSRSTLIS